MAELKIKVVTDGDAAGAQKVTDALNQAANAAEILRLKEQQAAQVNAQLTAEGDKLTKSARESASAFEELFAAQDKVKQAAANAEEGDAMAEHFRQLTQEAKAAGEAVEQKAEPSIKKMGEGLKKLGKEIPGLGEAFALLTNPWAAIGGAITLAVGYVKSLIEKENEAAQKAADIAKEYDGISAAIKTVEGDWQKTLDTLEDYEEGLARVNGQDQSPENKARRKERDIDRETRKQDRIDAAKAREAEARVDFDVAQKKISKQEGEIRKRTIARGLEDRSVARAESADIRKFEINRQLKAEQAQREAEATSGLPEATAEAERLEKSAARRRMLYEANKKQRAQEVETLTGEINALEITPDLSVYDRALLERKKRQREGILDIEASQSRDMAMADRAAKEARDRAAQVAQEGIAARQGGVEALRAGEEMAGNMRSERQATDAERKARRLSDAVQDFTSKQEELADYTEKMSKGIRTVVTSQKALVSEVEELRKAVNRLQGQ